MGNKIALFLSVDKDCSRENNTYDFIAIFIFSYN